MKLGISYNLFDGEELLEGSIKRVRDYVDYISVVYQKISNFGNPANESLIPLLENLKNQGLIDNLTLYEPKHFDGHDNEINKRNIGLSLSRQNGCTHHMSMDSDEYYIPSEFEYMKNKIYVDNVDCGYVQMLTYYKTWDYIIDPPEEYYVPTIIKIKSTNTFIKSYPSHVLVDPTRRISQLNNSIIFRRDEVQMHHGSYIRNDIRKKFENSSANVNFKNEIDRLVENYENWSFPNQALLAGLPCKLNDVIKPNNTKFYNED
jgi:hypothetical protein